MCRRMHAIFFSRLGTGNHDQPPFGMVDSVPTTKKRFYREPVLFADKALGIGDLGSVKLTSHAAPLRLLSPSDTISVVTLAIVCG